MRVFIIHLVVEMAEFVAGQAQHPPQRCLICKALTPWRDHSDTQNSAGEPSLGNGDPQDVTQGSWANAGEHWGCLTYPSL